MDFASLKNLLPNTVLLTVLLTNPYSFVEGVRFISVVVRPFLVRMVVGSTRNNGPIELFLMKPVLHE